MQNSKFKYIPFFITAFVIVSLILILFVAKLDTAKAPENSQKSASYYVSSYYSKSSSKAYKNIQVKILELADTVQKQNKGMMNRGRDQICDTCGMMFIFDSERIQNFWMKDTLSSLDIIFVNKQGEVIKIHKNTLPEQTEQTYSSEKPSMYVLEFLSGYSDKQGLKEGDVLDIQSLLGSAVEYNNSFDKK